MDRHDEHARKSASATSSGTVVDPRASFALWLRTGRGRKNLTLDDVARITKIQPRILEKLESGHLDGLPAEVFVRGFVRCFARCVGLDEGEALDRYRACLGAGAPVARAFVETVVPAAPRASAPVIEVVDMTAPPAADPAPSDGAVAAPPAPARPPKDRARKRNRKRKARADARAREAAPIEAASVEPEPVEPAPVEPEPVEAAPVEAAPVEPEPVEAAPVEAAPVEAAPVEAPLPAIIALPAAPWVPTMPVAATAPSVPWRRGRFSAPTTRSSDPRLVIDDADPESAEREQEARAAAAKDQKVSFLPPILLDREDRSARQGGLTLAVILLLVAATLTLSYLMRRPSTSGDGVTLRETPSALA